MLCVCLSFKLCGAVPYEEVKEEKKICISRKQFTKDLIGHVEALFSGWETLYHMIYPRCSD